MRRLSPSPDDSSPLRSVETGRRGRRLSSFAICVLVLLVLGGIALCASTRIRAVASRLDIPTGGNVNLSEFNKKKYDEQWAELNVVLNNAMSADGLPAALGLLEEQQSDIGFIQDDLKAVERYRVCDPHDHSRVFTVQFNPRRALRHLGAGRAVPPRNVERLHNDCFLDPENIRWQQRGIEMGFEIESTIGTPYIVWMNPFPLMPTHTTIATKHHLPQSWLSQDPGKQSARIREVLTDLLFFARQLPGFVGFYNGEGAGATIPGHFHFQFFKRPEGQIFPLEAAARAAIAGHDSRPPLVIRKYPIKAIYFSGSEQEIVKRAAAWAEHWTESYERNPALSANIVVVRERHDRERFHLYFVPRNKHFSHAPGIAGLVGGLEILGEFVFSTEAEKQQLQSGHIDYGTLVRVLAGVEAPGVEEFLNNIPALTVA